MRDEWAETRPIHPQVMAWPRGLGPGKRGGLPGAGETSITLRRTRLFDTARYDCRLSQSLQGITMSESHAEHMRAVGATVAQSAGLHPFAALPAKPTLADIFLHRLHVPWFGLPIAAARHGVQCATLAMQAGCDEETILACLLHDIGLAVNRPDHGWWGAQLVEPYVTERVTWAIRYHQALRYFADSSVGYEYPETAA